MNLYYGGGHLCGRRSPGWRWLDLSALVQRLVDRNARWRARGAVVRRVVYCTARVTPAMNPVDGHRQGTYLDALAADGRITVEFGTFKIRRRPSFSEEKGLTVTTGRTEEKGSDVNLATRLLIDIYEQEIDAAILVTNDSDLRLPAQHARTLVPVGTVNPRGRYTAQDLRGRPGDGVGDHWWYRLNAEDFYSCQLPEVVAGVRRPPGW